MSLFPSISDQCDEQEISEIESLCLNCGSNGLTRLLLTSIPFYRQVVLMSFECSECHWTNNELQPAQRIEEKGVRFTVHCKSEKVGHMIAVDSKIHDLSRQIVKTEHAEIQIPEIEFEVKKQNGLITTIEGIIERAIEGLKETQKQLISQDPKSSEKISDFLLKLCQLKQGDVPFTFILDDISGNSFVENPCLPKSDPDMEVKHYERSAEHDKLLGIYESLEPLPELSSQDEVLQLGTNCPNCNAPCFTNVKTLEIPHFQQVVIMATNCEACGHKTNEIKSGSGIAEKGIKIILKVDNDNILKYDVVRSDTCSLCIPELDLELSSTGSGSYTTVEGLVESIKEQLKNSNPFIDGDSAQSEIREKLNKIVIKLETLACYTIILDDPCGNSFVENVDENNVVRYERSWEQNEELGLNDIKTEGYIS